jgi:ABC-type nitrate/sulfonate/bicarbonate transport system permease component
VSIGPNIAAVMLRYRSLLIGGASVFWALMLWQLAGTVGALSGATGVPTLASVLQAGKSWFDTGVIFTDVIATLSRVIPGLFFGSVAGAAVGIITGRWRLAYELLAPFLHILRAMPAVALAPLLLLILSVSEPTRIFIVALGVFFPVWINAHEGARQVDSRFIEVASDLRMGVYRLYRHVIIPSTIPFIVAGVRAGIGLAYVMVFIAEWIGASQGIGYRLSISHAVLRTDHMVFGLLVLGLMAYGTDVVYRITVQRLFPWIER